jgi:hypothetical protein
MEDRLKTRAFQDLKLRRANKKAVLSQSRVEESAILAASIEGKQPFNPLRSVNIYLSLSTGKANQNP